MTGIRLTAGKGLLKIFFALLLVVIIMFVSNYIVYRNSISVIYGQVNENNKLIVRNMIRSFDDSFKNINDIVYAINGLPYEAWDDKEGKVDLYSAYLIQKEILKMISSIDYITDVVTFYNGSNLAITSKGTIDMNELFKQNYRHKLFTADYWKSYAAFKHPLRVFPAEDFASTVPGFGEQSRKLHVVLGNNQLSRQNVMVIIDADKLLQHVNQTAMMQGTSLIVLDQERNVILSTEQNWDLVQALNDMYETTGASASLKQKDFEFNFFKSDYNDYIYIDKVPYKFNNMKSITEAGRLIMVTTIIGAVILSAMLSLYLYRPIKDLLKLFGVRNAGWADLRSLQMGIRKIQEENETYRMQMNYVDSEIRKGLFLHALEGFGQSHELESRMHQYFKDFFRDRYFVMVGFYVLQPAASRDVSSPKADEVLDFLQAGLQERFNDGVVFHAGHLRFLSVVGIHQGSDRDTLLRQIRDMVRQAEDGDGAGHRYSLLAAVSRTYPSKLQNCNLAVQDIVTGITYRNVGSDERVIDVEVVRYTWHVYFPLAETEKLSNCLINGNEAECFRIIQDILERNVERRIHHHQLVLIAKNLLFYMLSHLEKSGMMEQDEIRILERTALQGIENSFDCGDIQSVLLLVCRVVVRQNMNGQKSKLDQAAIAQYIEKSYMRNLDLNHMADMLQTSPKYFSNYFKKAFGVNFVEYLNKVRLARAKEFLNSNDWSVTEIGERIGYLNSTTFTSTFKKYYGISPSEYRKKSETVHLTSGKKTK